MASNNSKFNTEMKMAGTSFFIATLVFLFLKFLTTGTKRMQNKRLEEEKQRKCAQLRAEQKQALRNIEMNSRSRSLSFFEYRSKSDSSLLGFCHQSQRFTQARPQHSAYGTPMTTRTNEDIFNFDSKYMPSAEVLTIPRPAGFIEENTGGETTFGFADNYREWSLRRRDLEISAMNFKL